MKFKVGDKIKIVRATFGCRGAEGKIGTVTNECATYGLVNFKDGFNVDCGYGYIWRIGLESECELLDELTAEEAIKIQAEMCRSMKICADCPIHKAKGDCLCDSFRIENPEKVVEILRQWKKDYDKKEIETETVYLIRVMKEEGDSSTCIYTYEVKEDKDDIDEKMDELVKQYYEENGDKIYAKIERICRVKS